MMLRHATAVLSLAMLAACGGGGDDRVYDVEAAWRNVLAVDAGFTLSGIGSDGNLYTLDVVLANAGAGVYPLTGEIGARALQTTTLLRNGFPLDAPTNTTQFYDPASALLLGVRNDDDDTCATVVAHGTLPRAAPVGSAGVLYDATSFDSCGGGAVVVGSVESDWSIEGEDGIAFFCTNARQLDTQGNLLASEQDCISIDFDGSLGPFARVAVVLQPSANAPAGFTLVGRNY
jgi:hypothetical protein